MITGKDVSGWRIGRQIYDMPVLAENVVRFIGEKVASVAAETEEIAEQALDLIEVEYENRRDFLEKHFVLSWASQKVGVFLEGKELGLDLNKVPANFRQAGKR